MVEAEGDARVPADDSADYYDQGTEVQILAKLLGLLENKIVIDVGAERGSFVSALIEAGAESVYAFEPYPASLDALRNAFCSTPSVRILDMALGARDEQVALHIVEDKTGKHPDAYHSLVAIEDTPTLQVVGEVSVECRTLDSLVAEGVLPSEVGILKVDTERGDLAVLQGMGRLFSAIVMIEYWDDLPETVGPATYKVADVARFMAGRGYSSFVTIKRHDQFETLQINDPATRPGDWGNVLFIHDSVYPRVSSVLFEQAALAQTRLIDKAMFFANEANRRQALLDDSQAATTDMRRVAEERLAVIENVNHAAEQRLKLLQEEHQTAEERLAVIQHLQRLLDQEGSHEAEDSSRDARTAGCGPGGSSAPES